MNSINFSKGELSLCHKDNCVNIKGDLAKILTVSVALIVVIAGIASLIEASK